MGNGPVSSPCAPIRVRDRGLASMRCWFSSLIRSLKMNPRNVPHGALPVTCLHTFTRRGYEASRRGTCAYMFVGRCCRYHDALTRDIRFVLLPLQCPSHRSRASCLWRRALWEAGLGNYKYPLNRSTLDPQAISSPRIPSAPQGHLQFTPEAQAHCVTVIEARHLSFFKVPRPPRITLLLSPSLRL